MESDTFGKRGGCSLNRRGKRQSPKVSRPRLNSPTGGHSWSGVFLTSVSPLPDLRSALMRVNIIRYHSFVLSKTVRMHCSPPRRYWTLPRVGYKMSNRWRLNTLPHPPKYVFSNVEFYVDFLVGRRRESFPDPANSPPTLHGRYPLVVRDCSPLRTPIPFALFSSFPHGTTGSRKKHLWNASCRVVEGVVEVAEYPNAQPDFLRCG
jgi:hypothetical protein